MSEPPALTGGCLCGALRWSADREPQFQGYCFCADCRKASGSGFIGFMNFPAEALTFSGESKTFVSRSWRGTNSTRNSCPTCHSLVFGGIVGKDTDHTIYAGSLDDPAQFRPQVGIFARDKPDWVHVPEAIRLFETMPD